MDFTGGDGVDRFGHGTHVAAIIAGQRGPARPTRASYRGMASGAYLVNLRVLGDDGSGDGEQRDRGDRLGDRAPAPYNIRRHQPVARRAGAAAVPRRSAVRGGRAGGARGHRRGGGGGQLRAGRRTATSVFGAITSPGNSPYALTVGAIDTHGTPQRSDDTLATYSSKGPTRYDLVIKPDVVAPGSHIVSAEAAGSYLSQTYPERHVAGSGRERATSSCRARAWRRGW